MPRTLNAPGTAVSGAILAQEYRDLNGRGHQFKNDLADVADDIKKAASIAS